MRPSTGLPVKAYALPMPNTRRRTLATLAALSLAVAACSSTSSRTLTDASGAATSESALATSDAGSTTTAGPATTASPVSSEPATTKPAPATTKPAPPTTKPQPTTPPTPAPTTPPTAAPGPKITSASFSGAAVCASPDVSIVTVPPTVHISWSATGADSVYVAIDNQDGPFESNLPLQGSAELPFSCPGPHTYWVVAVKGGQKDSRSQTFG